VLIDRTFNVHTPLEAMSPIAIEPDFTRRYIDNANNEHLLRRIRNSFDRAAWEKDFVIIEGTGHAGVGSVFDLSNARVANILHSKVVLVTGGGIGKPIDEIALNKALFDREGVEVAGVIVNKVLPEKLDFIKDFCRRGLARLGIELLGVIPVEPILAHPTLEQVCEAVHGEFVNKPAGFARRIQRVIIGAMSSSHVIQHFRSGTLVITPGDREDVVLAGLSTKSIGDQGHDLAGLVLSGDMRPGETILNLINASALPVIATAMDSYTVASRIHSMTIKTLPGDVEKIDRIQSLIETHVDVERLLEKISHS
jgi:BioD-like phosphotransacetylase family protein